LLIYAYQSILRNKGWISVKLLKNTSRFYYHRLHKKNNVILIESGLNESHIRHHYNSMLKHIPNTDWLYCINSFRYTTPTHPGVLKVDRSFTPRNYQDAILNNNRGSNELALSVSMPLLDTLVEHSSGKAYHHKQNAVRQYLDHLTQEAIAVSRLIPANRKVTYLHWQGDLPYLLTPAQMTELMFILNKYFEFEPEEKGRFVIEFVEPPKGDNDIALIRGLGFNRICLGTQSTLITYPTDLLRSHINLFRSYKFKAINLRFMLKSNMECLELKNHLDELIQMEPDTIYLVDEDEKHRMIDKSSSCNQEMICHSSLANQLIEAGYTQINHVKYSRDPHEPNYKVRDIIGLGLGAVSMVDNIFVQNHTQLDKYYSTLGSEKSPVNLGGYIFAA